MYIHSNVQRVNPTIEYLGFSIDFYGLQKSCLFYTLNEQRNGHVHI